MLRSLTILTVTMMHLLGANCHDDFEIITIEEGEEFCSETAAKGDPEPIFESNEA